MDTSKIQIKLMYHVLNKHGVAFIFICHLSSAGIFTNVDISPYFQ